MFKHVSPPEERVWGAAYHIPAEHEEYVRSYLDIREINGYSLHRTPFFVAEAMEANSGVNGATPRTIDCEVYIGLPTNPQFVGPQDPEALAKHILQSSGPSGENKEYLYMLEDALEGLSPESGDQHVADLVARCRGLEKMGIVDVEHQRHLADGHLQRVTSTEEQEEIEK
jgi:cation transport protein ChaC